MNKPPVPAEPSVDLATTSDRIDEHPVVVYLAGLSKSSRRTMGDALDTIAQIVAGDDADRYAIPWHQLRFQHAQAVRSELQARYAHSTVNRMLSALRGTLKAAWKLGLLTAEEYHTAASVRNVKGHTEPAGRNVPIGEITALLNTCDQSRTGIRDAAIISILYGCGLRRAELVGLDLGDYRPGENDLLVRGKGNKERAVPLGSAAHALGDWLRVRGNAPGPLFWGTGNRNRGGRMTSQAIYWMLRERAKRAGVPGLSPHDFRRTFVGDLLDAGADLATVQKLAGHADPAVTSRYDRRDKRVKEEAVGRLHVPYTQRMLQEG